jgi:D-tyrosyl-tRNA(Tyr) deacylase
MRAVVQRVRSATVSVDGETFANIGKGLVVLLGIRVGDAGKDSEWMASKLTNLRIFDDSDGKLNMSVLDAGGEMLMVSNFTVYGDASKGRRPSFVESASYEDGRTLFEDCCNRVASLGVPVSTGVYGAAMAVSLTNDGPVTILIETP